MINDRVAIVVGHTDDNAGASMAEPYAYVQEYEYNTVLSGICSAILTKRGVDNLVVLRDGVGIDGAYKIAIQYQPIAIIELHFNSTSKPEVKGTETLYGGIEGAKLLADYVQTEICSLFKRGVNGNGNRGTRYRGFNDRGGKSLNHGAAIPTIMVEPFFGSNVSDSESALLKIGQLAEAIIDGYFTWRLASQNLTGLVN